MVTLAARGRLLKKMQVPRKVKVAAHLLHPSTGRKQLPRPTSRAFTAKSGVGQLKQLMSKCPTKKKTPRDLPGGPVVKTSPSNAGVRFLVRELRFHMLQRQKTKT